MYASMYVCMYVYAPLIYTHPAGLHGARERSALFDMAGWTRRLESILFSAFDVHVTRLSKPPAAVITV